MLTVNKLELEASLCRESFYDFFLRFWPVVSGEKLVLNWHIKVLCDELQAIGLRVFGTVDVAELFRARSQQRLPKRVRQPKIHDLIINIPPGTTKSTICSVMFPIWCWLHDPTCRLICGSYTEDLALYLASQGSRVVNSEKFKTLFPEIELVKNTGHLMETKQGGWRFSTSTGGSCIGKHAHIQIIDDPINAQNAISEASLRQANNWLDHTMPSRFVNKLVGVFILVMQRLAQDDPTGHKLAKQNSSPIRLVRLPAVLTGKVQPRSLRKHYVDGLLDPVRMPLPLLNALEQGDMGSYAYAGQYLQDPIPMGNAMFDVSKMLIVNAAGGMVKTIRYWDKAGTQGKGAFTVGVLMGVDRSRRFWILDVVRGQWEASTRERMIKQTAISDGRKIMIGVEQEPGSGGKESAQATVRNLAGWYVKLDRPVGDKAMRADPFSVQVNGDNVRLLKGTWNAGYLAELQFFPFSRFKDQVDASSGAFAMLVGRNLKVGAIFR